MMLATKLGQLALLCVWAQLLARLSAASDKAGQVAAGDDANHTFAGCGSYCSNAHVTSYVGPLDTTVQLGNALKQLSFKKEIIITHHAVLSEAIQVLHRWQRHGYGHTLLVQPTAEPCRHLDAGGAFRPLLGCGWFEDVRRVAFILNQTSGCKGMLDKWLIHYTAARAIRLGYNVLAVDADTLPLGDFYGLMRQPPYAGVQLWSQREGNFNVNGGFYYVQNASVSGPVAFLLYDNLLKNARWYADARPLRAAVGLSPNDTSTGIADGFLCNDQFSLSDSVHGAVTGTPQVLECLFHHTRDPSARGAWEAPHLQLYRGTGPRGAQQLGPYEQLTFPVPHALRLGSGGAATAHVTTAALHMPHGRGQWPAERGGLPFAPGPLPDMAAALRQLFREGAGVAAGGGGGSNAEVEMAVLPDFPDPYNPADQAAAAAVPPERFAYLPPWVANTWGYAPGANAGVEGHYNSHLTAALPALVSHLHAGLTPGDFNKQVHLAVGVPRGWSLDVGGVAAGGAARAAAEEARQAAAGSSVADAADAVSTATSGGSQVTSSASDGRAALAARGGAGLRRAGRRRRMLAASAAAPYAYLGTSAAAAAGMPPLLAVAPWVVRPDMSGAEFTELVQGLMRMGLALGRVVVWPWVPCEVPFLRRQGATYNPTASGHKIPWSDYLNVTAAIPNGPGSADLRRDGLRCLLAALDKHSCLRGGTAPPGPSPTAPRGLLPYEFDHWLAGAAAGASRRRGDRQRLLQQATGRRVQLATSHALSSGTSLPEAGVALDEGPRLEAGLGLELELGLEEVPLLPGPLNTIQDILERRGGSRAGDPVGHVGSSAAPAAAPALVLTATDLQLLLADPAVVGAGGGDSSSSSRRRRAEARRKLMRGGGRTPRGGDEGDDDEDEEVNGDKGAVSAHQQEGDEQEQEQEQADNSRDTDVRARRSSSSSSSSSSMAAGSQRDGDRQSAKGHAAAIHAPAAVLWLRGPVSVPQLPSAALEAFYRQQVEPLCCVLLGWPTAPDCMWRSPAAQVAMAAGAAAAAAAAEAA
ncbi:hypothetical protein HYH02_015116 [Chlamydomonas schloesseri]|uniref:Nucleotide-diphospho-sugar transferase domain-containing protein n=1 Tax=Chlamydomonas schloesseri TaxID=2026947 RepID=A0A835SCP4_9CHLO|nr:hypothetical protein HYH02_015116 [Chlamydomonas schloesseri]|eukprot:KAG2424853.1 hypothetical protein HYH02_015116 [Chlamydomonas schloesseri]